MDKKQLLALIATGEGYKIEFKESVNNIDRDLVAFANSSGGRILIGVTNTGERKGVTITNDLRSQLRTSRTIATRP